MCERNEDGEIRIEKESIHPFSSDTSTNKIGLWQQSFARFVVCTSLCYPKIGHIGEQKRARVEEKFSSSEKIWAMRQRRRERVGSERPAGEKIHWPSEEISSKQRCFLPPFSEMNTIDTLWAVQRVVLHHPREYRNPSITKTNPIPTHSSNPPFSRYFTWNSKGIVSIWNSALNISL